MNNKQFVKKALKEADVIYMDSSSLLKPDRLEKFLEGSVIKNGKIFGKKITIIEAVRKEMMRKIDDPETTDLVNAAAALMSKYKDLFTIEGDHIDESLIAKAHADKDFLSILTLNKPFSCQLVITNDSALGSDILNLNEQKSVKGKQIYACYIDGSGLLRSSGSQADEETDDKIDSQKKSVSTTDEVPPKKVNNKKRIENHTVTYTSDNNKELKGFVAGFATASTFIGFSALNKKYKFLDSFSKRIGKIFKK